MKIDKSIRFVLQKTKEKRVRNVGRNGSGGKNKMSMYK